MHTPAKESSSRCVISKHKSSAKNGVQHNCSFSSVAPYGAAKIEFNVGPFEMYLFSVLSDRLRKPFWKLNGLMTYYQWLLIFEFSDYEAFKEAAEQFQPYIKFFATFEKSVSHKNNADRNRLKIAYVTLEWPVTGAPGGQGADPEAERSGFLWALHGGAAHHPGQASLWGAAGGVHHATQAVRVCITKCVYEKKKSNCILE